MQTGRREFRLNSVNLVVLKLSVFESGGVYFLRYFLFNMYILLYINIINIMLYVYGYN